MPAELAQGNGGRFQAHGNFSEQRWGDPYLNNMDVEEEDWDRIHRVNAKGVFFCMRRVAIELIRQAEGGRIINIASIAELLG